ncbi:MAG: Ku protein, partial [Myxococcales bacterium]
MARPIWSGSISFGLVNVPVNLYSATSSHKVAFHQFERGTGERIRYKRVAEESGKEVGWDDIVKGYEVEKGRYVIVEKEELEAVEPNRSRTIEIEEFVRLAEIDPIAWDKTYYLAPKEDVGAERPYMLLLKAL